MIKEAAKSQAALLIIDVISDFEFVDGEKPFKYAQPMVRIQNLSDYLNNVSSI